MTAYNSTVGVPDNSSYKVDIKSIDISAVNIVDTTLQTAIIMSGSATVSAANMSGISVGDSLRIGSIGNFQDEIVVVSAINGTTFTGFFTLPHNVGDSITMDAGRQKMVIADPYDYDSVATVGSGPVSVEDSGLTVRIKPNYIGNTVFVGPIITSQPVSGYMGSELITPQLITINKTAILKKVMVSSSVPMKWELQGIADQNSSEYGIETAFTSAMNLNYTFKFNEEVQIVNADGIASTFQMLATNFDLVSADAYVTFYWIEA